MIGFAFPGIGLCAWAAYGIAKWGQSPFCGRWLRQAAAAKTVTVAVDRERSTATASELGGEENARLPSQGDIFIMTSNYACNSTKSY